MTSLAHISSVDEGAFGIPDRAGTEAPPIHSIAVSACPCCQRPLDASNVISESLPLGRRSSGDLRVLVWCPACVSGFRLFFRDDGATRLLVRGDRLEPTESDAQTVKRHFEQLRDAKETNEDLEDA